MSDTNPSPHRREPVIRDLVEYLIIVVPDVASLSGVTSSVRRLVHGTAIRVLDLAVVVKESDGSVEILEPHDVESLTQIPEVECAINGLLSEGDLELVALAVQPGAVGMVVVTEDRWAIDLSVAAHEAGGEIVTGERIPPARVAAILGDPDALPSSQPSKPGTRPPPADL